MKSLILALLLSIFIYNFVFFEVDIDVVIFRPFVPSQWVNLMNITIDIDKSMLFVIGALVATIAIRLYSNARLNAMVKTIVQRLS